MSSVPGHVTTDQIDDVKKWIINTVRQTMRGERATTQIKRWLSGELGSSHSFSFPIVLDERVYAALKNELRRAEINEEKL
jgi:hypothetical protein